MWHESTEYCDRQGIRGEVHHRSYTVSSYGEPVMVITEGPEKGHPLDKDSHEVLDDEKDSGKS